MEQFKIMPSPRAGEVWLSNGFRFQSTLHRPEIYYVGLICLKASLSNGTFSTSIVYTIVRFTKLY